MMHDWKALVRARLGMLEIDPARAADIEDELAQHVAQHYAELVASGIDEAEAMARALAPLGDRRHVAAEIARADRVRPTAPPPPAASGSVVTDIWRDVRYAVRVLRQAPGFTLAAVLTLALGIGANATIFSVLNAVLLRPLPYAEPSRLVTAGERTSAGRASNVGFATFLDWREQSRAFEDLALIRFWEPTLAGDGEPARIEGLRVSSNYFRMLGIRPALGRDFTAADDTPNTWRVVILSDGLWRRRFSADPSIIGRTLRMNDVSYEVIGVMPANYEPLLSEHYYRRAEMWAPVGYDLSLNYACRSCQHLKAIGRIRSGATIAGAEAELNEIHRQQRAKFPNDYSSTSSLAVVPLAEELSGDVRPALTALMGAVAFVLLIACANVANLLLARIARRQHDLALRAALGASRGRIVRQLLIESVVLGAVGGGLGILAAALAVPLLVHLTPVTISRLSDARVDLAVIAYSAGLSLLTTIGFGLLPALRASRVNLSSSLHGDGRRTASAPASGARRLLIAVDVALAVVLLAGAGLMIRSVSRLLGVDPGFDPDRVLTMQISLGGTRFAKREAIVQGGDEMLDRIRALPGVTAAAVAGQIPLGGNGDMWGFHIQGRAWGADDPSVERYSVTPDYFSVMRIPLVRGRLIGDEDREGRERVMLLGEYTARTLWPNADPIGQHVRIGGTTGPDYTIVGIVGDVRHHELAKPPTMQMYLAQRQLPDGLLIVVIRTAGEPAAVADGARRAIWSVAPEVPISDVTPLADLVAKSVGPRRFVMLLLELFGAIALVMTAVGVYGVIAYSVAERTREIGVRAALGASRAAIARLVIANGFVVVGAGLVTGTLAALAATRYLQSSLFGVSAADPVTFVGVVLVLLAVTVLAQVIPVLRAVRVDPAVALRQE